VIGVPDERWGHRVAVVLAPFDGHQISFAALEQHTRTHLAGYKIPRLFWITETVARTPSGKPDYRTTKAFAADREPDHQVPFGTSPA
jgi:fatty-acyl-CoA synthase